jgi:hypothetical protein
MSTENENDLDVEEVPAEGVYVDVEDKVEKPEGTGKVASKEESVSIEERNEENAELNEAENDEEREAIRARRREERHAKKQKSKEREHAKDRLVASLQMQVQDLNERLSQVDRRQSGTDFAKLEEELNQAIVTANEAKEHLKNAAEAQDGIGVAEATDLYYTARRRAEFLAGVKQKVTKQGVMPAPQLDSRIVNHASQWMSKNKWYSHAGEDVDSATTKAVDNQLAKEGYDPRTKEYWEELDDRLSDKLPHRYGKVKTNGARANTPPVAGSDKNSGGGSSGSGKFYLSAARVQALRDSGDWEDETRRNKMIKTYQAYDRENANKDRK